MARYLIVRVTNGVVVVVIVSVVVFLVVALLPGDPAETMLGQSAPPEAVQAIRGRMGLNEPIQLRYFTWVAGVVRGDLGASAQGGQPVGDLVRQAFPVTGELTLLALLIAIVLSLSLGTVAAVRPRSLLGWVAGLWTYLALSVPSFWLGILFITVFAVRLNVLPAIGYIPIGQDLIGNIRSIALPAFTLGIVLSAPLTRYLRASIVNELRQDYVLTAEMKGLRPAVILVRHILPNSLLPYITTIGIQFAWLIGGAVVIEVLFALPGMGRLAVQSVFDRDYLIVQGVVLVVAVGVVATSLVIDLVYVLVDPRTRVGATVAK